MRRLLAPVLLLPLALPSCEPPRPRISLAACRESVDTAAVTWDVTSKGWRIWIQVPGQPSYLIASERDTVMAPIDGDTLDVTATVVNGDDTVASATTHTLWATRPCAQRPR